MDPVQNQKIAAALQSKGVRLPCPRCGSSKFGIAGETMINIQDKPNVFQIGGPAIPTVIVVCEHCGYLTQHAKAPLGLM